MRFILVAVSFYHWYCGFLTWGNCFQQKFILVASILSFFFNSEMYLKACYQVLLKFCHQSCYSRSITVKTNRCSYLQNLFDTPGVHLHHRQAAVVHSNDLPSLAPQSRLKGQSFPVCWSSICLVSEILFRRVNSYYFFGWLCIQMISNETATDQETVDLNGYSLFWGGLVRIDVIKVLY